MIKDLPNESDIEIAVLGGIIQNPRKYNDIAKYVISDKVWYDNKSIVLWKIITGMIKRREHIDMITLTSTLTEEDKVMGVEGTVLVRAGICTGVFNV